MKAWKRFELRVAKLLGGVRNPLSGGASRHTSGDVIHPRFYIKCKQRAKWLIWTLWENVRRKARKEGKIPLLVIHKKGRKEALVVLEIKDFVKLTGSGGEKRLRGSREGRDALKGGE